MRYKSLPTNIIIPKRRAEFLRYSECQCISLCSESKEGHYPLKVLFIMIHNRDPNPFRISILPFIVCVDGQVRLEDGRDASTGLVELCVNGSWRGICGDGWDTNDTEVVCQQLHYNYGGSYSNAVEVRCGKLV